MARLWPVGSGPVFPSGLGPESSPKNLEVDGVGRSLAIECFVNAVLPVALASGAWKESEAEAAYLRLASPGTYGKLKSLEGWLGGREARPFAGAARLQGGLLLHSDYCTRGMCGRCPLSE